MGLLQDVLTVEVVIDSHSYIFDEAGGKRDQLEQTILNELNLKKYPYPVTIKNVKSGGVFGSKEQCVTIEVNGNKRVVIANTTIGTYLYAHIYFLKRRVNDAKMAARLEHTITDIFETQKEHAAYSAAVAAVESAFAKLSLKQCNSGYKANEKNLDM